MFVFARTPCTLLAGFRKATAMLGSKDQLFEYRGGAALWKKYVILNIKRH